MEARFPNEVLRARPATGLFARMKPGLKRQWALAFAFWSVPALLFMLLSLQRGEPFGWSLLAESVPWLIWGVLTPLVFAQAQRHPMDAGQRRRDIAVHAATGIAIGLVYGTINIIVLTAFGLVTHAPTASWQGIWARHALPWVPFTLIIYGVLASVGLAIAYQQRLQERSLAAARLQAQLADAQLNALRMQLDPHFLFNTLNTISMHVRDGNMQLSVRLLARLSELLRHMLEQRAQQEVPLSAELDYVERYLEIEGARFGDRLRTSIAVPDALRSALVPNLLLQPLVENAIRHGIARRADAGLLELRAERVDGLLRIELVNEGVMLPPSFDTRAATGIGLRNTSTRLEHLYGDQASLRLVNRPPSSVAAIVELPWHTAANGGAA
jgi:two-component system LytT family sensor kinase